MILMDIMPYLLFLKKKANKKNCRLLQIIGGALWDNVTILPIYFFQFWNNGSFDRNKHTKEK